MPNTIKTISLTDDDKSYLNKLLTQSTLEIRVYQRARILLLKSEGASNKAIADKLDIGISVVKRCLNKFKENGVEASLRDNKGRGRKAEITDDDITWVISKACQKPKDYGYSAEFWYPMSFRKFINSIAETEGHPRMATVAETTLRKILSNARIKPFQVSYYCERRDPEFDAKMHDVLVIYKQIEMQFDKDGKLMCYELLPAKRSCQFYIVIYFSDFPCSCPRNSHTVNCHNKNDSKCHNNQQRIRLPDPCAVRV